MANIRKLSLIEEFDYNFLLDILKSYKYPRNKIKKLIDSKKIIRVKKGIYVFGKDLSLEPYSLESLANMIYGPSYISLEYALSFYGMIPESVKTITSITNKRNKLFKTELGDFSYKYINPKVYSLGITINKLDKNHSVLMATREKALIDILYFNKKLMTNLEMKEYLYKNLRIEKYELMKLDLEALRELEFLYGKFVFGISDFIENELLINKE